MMFVRTETAEDISAVHRLNELAFGRPNEADLVDALRRVAHPFISLVAENKRLIAGHICFSPITLEAEDSLLIL